MCAYTFVACFVYSFYSEKAINKLLEKLRNIQVLFILLIMHLDVPRQATEFLSNLRRLIGFDSFLSFGLADSDSVVGSSLSEQA